MHAMGSVKPEPPEPRTGLRLQGTLISLALSAGTTWVGPSSSPPPSLSLSEQGRSGARLPGWLSGEGDSDRPPCSASPPPSPPTSSVPFSPPDVWISLSLLFCH